MVELPGDDRPSPGRDFGNIGLTLNANYTWSHSLDNLSSTFSDANANAANNGQFLTGYLDPYAPMLDKGSSDFDLRQRLAVSAVWEIPAFKNGRGFAHQIFGGWSLDPIWTAETGQPFSIFDCGNANYVCSRAEFAAPIAASGPGSPAAVPGAANTFNYINFPASITYASRITGFSDYPPFPSGITGRNVFRAPGRWFLDVGLYKTFSLTERVKLQLRGEAYNLFNHPNLYVEGAGADVSSSTSIAACYGCTGATEDRRNLQLAAKITF